MDRKLIKLLEAMTTDSRVLADYQRDPAATLAAFGLVARGLKELVESERAQKISLLGGGAAANSGGTNVTH